MIVKGKTIVISGVGLGLGREIAAAALRDGANVAIAARTEGKLRELAAELDPSGERIVCQVLNIKDEDSCAALMQTATDRFGGVDAVVQVAAFELISSTLESTSLEEWRQSFETNVVGTTQVVRAAVPDLKARGGGAVVLIGSQSMWLPQLAQMAYAASKGALVSAMFYMARELGPHKIRVNMVVPTWMWGPPVQAYVNWQADERGVPVEDVIREITSNMPLGEIPTDGDVAEAVLFLCSDRARMITGQTLMVNAGELLR